MAQLTKDTFAFGGKLATIDDIMVLVAERTPVVAGIEEVDLGSADGRVLADDLIAPVDLPPFDNSAVDGYAVAHGDLAPNGETAVRVAGRIAAGEHATRRLDPSTTARIFSGAPIPAGADTVFMQEDVRVLDDGRVVFPTGLHRGANTRPRGEDIRKGAVAITGGQRLDPRFIAMAAALGSTHLAVRRPLRVAVFSTGDEIVTPGDALPPAGLYDSNRYALMALLRRRGCIVTDLGILRDDLASVSDRISAAVIGQDAVLTSGGISAGEEDHVRAAIERTGSLVFWRLAIKPGRPVAMGLVNGVPIVGLPGNPVATFVTFAFVVQPLLAALGGERLTPIVAMPVLSRFDYKKKAGRREFVRARLVRRDDGTFEAHKHPVDGAGVLTSLTRTDGLVVIPEDKERVDAGERVDFIAYGLLL